MGSVAGDRGKGLKDKIVQKSLAATTLAEVEIRTQLREQTPKATGRTSRGWFATPPVFDGQSITFSIRHPQTRENPPDPRWLSEGTRGPYIIRARNAKVLAFPGRISSGQVGIRPTTTGGDIVFRKQVLHPGIEGTGFIENVLSPGNIKGIFVRAFQIAM